MELNNEEFFEKMLGGTGIIPSTSKNPNPERIKQLEKQMPELKKAPITLPERMKQYEPYSKPIAQQSRSPDEIYRVRMNLAYFRTYHLPKMLNEISANIGFHKGIPKNFSYSVNYFNSTKPLIEQDKRTIISEINLILENERLDEYFEAVIEDASCYQAIQLLKIVSRKQSLP